MLSKILHVTLAKSIPFIANRTSRTSLSSSTVVSAINRFMLSAFILSGAIKGVEAKPVNSPHITPDITLPAQMNPGGTSRVLVPASNFGGNDATYANITEITINSLPTNTTSITINGTTTYDASNFPLAGVTIPADASGRPTHSIEIDPIDGSVTAVFSYVCTHSLGITSPVIMVFVPFNAPQPFTCSNNAVYQVAGPGASPTTLYSYDINSGVRTTLGANSVQVNSIGFNTADNLIWGFDRTNSKVVKMDMTGATASYTISNLPLEFNVGDVFDDGYLFLYNRGASRYYIVDINPTRATYLKLMEHNAGSYVEDIAPYGMPLTGASTALTISDLSYNSTAGLFYGLIDPTGGNAFRIVTVNPLTGAVAFSPTAVTGGGIQSENSAFGSVFSDANFEKLYVFANAQGRYFEIDIATRIATLLSISIASGDNDGASCPLSSLSTSISGRVFHDVNQNTIIDGTEGAAVLPSPLYIYIVDATGIIADSAMVALDGSYKLRATPGGNYTLNISSTAYPVGTDTNITPISGELPTGWVPAGENGAGNTGPGDGSPDGVLAVTAGVGSMTDQNFGIKLGSVLPVKLTNFSAVKDNNIAKLFWQTTFEQNNKGFEIERSSNEAQTWNNIGFIVSSAERGNSNKQLPYSFNDYSAVGGVNYYRIKQIDLDGNFVYSEHKVVDMSKTNHAMHIYPNPVIGVVILEGLNNVSHIKVVDRLGAVLVNVKVAANEIKKHINLSHLAAGVYFININNKNETVTVHKIVKQ